MRTVEPRLYEHQGTVKIHSPHPEFVLTGIIFTEKAVKGTEIVFVLTVFVLEKFYCIFRSNYPRTKFTQLMTVEPR